MTDSVRMVGVNVGVPAPVAPFRSRAGGESFFGDLHCRAWRACRFTRGRRSLPEPVGRGLHAAAEL
jgi:hypothetical protein